MCVIQEALWQSENRNGTALSAGLPAVRGDRPDKDNLVGLAFSGGGGIRSATFNLGVLEALKKLNLLNKIDYL